MVVPRVGEVNSDQKLHHEVNRYILRDWNFLHTNVVGRRVPFHDSLRCTHFRLLRHLEMLVVVVPWTQIFTSTSACWYNRDGQRDSIPSPDAWEYRLERNRMAIAYYTPKWPESPGPDGLALRFDMDTP